MAGLQPIICACWATGSVQIRYVRCGDLFPSFCSCSVLPRPRILRIQRAPFLLFVNEASYASKFKKPLCKQIAGKVETEQWCVIEKCFSSLVIPAFKLALKQVEYKSLNISQVLKKKQLMRNTLYDGTTRDVMTSSFGNFLLRRRLQLIPTCILVLGLDARLACCHMTGDPSAVWFRFQLVWSQTPRYQQIRCAAIARLVQT